MKIAFEDKSYIELTQQGNDIIIVLCGNKDRKQLTISSVRLSIDHIKQIITFLNMSIQ